MEFFLRPTPDLASSSTRAAVPTASEEKNPGFDLGILFVHGIGEQRQGMTLVRFADSLFDWLYRWLNKTDQLESESNWGSVVTLRDTQLTPPPSDPDVPAHTVLQIQESRRNQLPPPRCWLLAESWWAETFQPPGFKGLASWTLSLVPKLLFLQSGNSLRRTLERGGRVKFHHRWLGGPWSIFTASVMFIASVPLSLFMLSIILFLLAVALLPIPPLRRFITLLGLRLSASLGDSYVLTSSPTSFDSMLEQVRRDLNWLAPQCKAIAVLAHSQGAALAHEVLNKKRPDNLRLFAMLGSGLRRLHSLRCKSEVSSHAWGAIVAVSIGLLGLLLIVLRFTTDIYAQSSTASLVFGELPIYLVQLGTFLGSRTLLRILRSPDEILQVRKDLPLRPDDADLAWVDYYASADPVSNGPTFETSPYIARYLDKELTSRKESVENLERKLRKFGTRRNGRPKKKKNLEAALNRNEVPTSPATTNK